MVGFQWLEWPAPIPVPETPLELLVLAAVLLYVLLTFSRGTESVFKAVSTALAYALFGVVGILVLITLARSRDITDPCEPGPGVVCPGETAPAGG